MRAKIDEFVDFIKRKETRKKYAPILMTVGFALLVASAVLLILSIVGIFLPSVGNVDFSTVFKIAGMGIFAALVGRQWSTIRLEHKKKMTEEEVVKYLEGPAEDVLELTNEEETLELPDSEILEVDAEPPVETKQKK